MQAHKTVSREEWLEARRALLAKEKEVLKAKDALRQETRELPWVKVDKEYVFEGPNGKETLSDLFAGRSQLVVRHFMLGPGWKEGCVGCSFGADQTDGSVVHLINHDVMFVTVSRAPYAEIAAYHKRMGWTFKWVSSFGSDFNFDYHVSFTEEDEKRGKAFYGCENYPACDFVCWDKPVPEVCAECGYVGAEAKYTKARGHYRKCLKCGNEWDVPEPVEPIEPEAVAV